MLQNTNHFDPCLPITFSSDKTITISFSNTNTEICNNYYPEICNYTSNSLYYTNTKYMFNGGKSIIINNLCINDYVIAENRNYPIVESMGFYDASIIINYGSFRNISSSITSPLFDSNSNIHIRNSSFIDIKIDNAMFYGYHGPIQDVATRSFVFETSFFQNVSAQMIFEAISSINDVK